MRSNWLFYRNLLSRIIRVLPWKDRGLNLWNIFLYIRWLLLIVFSIVLGYSRLSSVSFFSLSILLGFLGLLRAIS